MSIQQAETYSFVRIADPSAAVGTAVRFMMGEQAFARLAFGDWARVLDGQVTRGHYGFVLDADHQVQGFLGWALATREKAEAWADGAALTDEDCREGDCLIVNAWVEKSPAVHRFMMGAVRDLGPGKAMVFFKRRWPDGTSRTVRMPVDDVVSGRVPVTPASRAGDPSAPAHHSPPVELSLGVRP